MGRTPLSKKTRFEVFKRDSFTCQYCGKSAPDVILEVDHIIPVAQGGTDDLFNLITSCRDCNRGKGKRMLSDKTTIEKQKAELDKLNKRREQLEMLVEWREELSNVESKEIDAVSDAIARVSEWEPNDIGRQYIKRLFRQFTLIEVLEAVDIAFDYYYKGDSETWNVAFNKIGGICYNRKKQKEAEDGDL